MMKLLHFNYYVAIIMILFPYIYFYTALYTLESCYDAFSLNYCLKTHLMYQTLLIIGEICISLLIGICSIIICKCTKY